MIEKSSYILIIYQRGKESVKKRNYLYLTLIFALLVYVPLDSTYNANAQLAILGPPTNLIATAVSSSQINLSWQAPSGTTVVTGYMIERSTNGGATWNAIVSNTGTTATTFDDTTVVPSTNYTYRVSALTLVLTSAPSNTASATTSAATVSVPSAPTGLTATAVSSSEIDLSWNAPSSDGGSPITGYRIKMSTDGSTFTTLVPNTSTTATTYSVIGLQPSTTYYFRVFAINSAGFSPRSNTASDTTQSGISTSAPSAPQNLQATAANAQVTLSWTTPSSDGGATITGYNVYRGTTSGGESSTPIATGITSTTYADTGLTNGVTYFYEVTAVNSVGESVSSNEASATPTTSNTGEITVYAHRIPATYWDPCFATSCSAGTGPGVAMYFELWADPAGNTVLQSGYADENGYSFTGLSPNTTYYVYPSDCDNCHGAPHNVVFEYWGDNHGNERPRAVTMGANLDAWYSCTNGCAGGP